MVEGDNSSGGTDKDEDIYCTIITGLIMFVLPLMVFTFLQAPLSNHPPLLTVFRLLCILLSSLLPPYTPSSQYVAHSCFSLKTVLLINWWLHTCNKSHDSRWTIHLLLWNGSDTTYTLGAHCKTPASQGPCSSVCHLADFDFCLLMTGCRDGFNYMWKVLELLKKKILLDNCLTVKWSARICSETSTRCCTV